VVGVGGALAVPVLAEEGRGGAGVEEVWSSSRGGQVGSSSRGGQVRSSSRRAGAARSAARRGRTGPELVEGRPGSELVQGAGQRRLGGPEKHRRWILIGLGGGPAWTGRITGLGTGRRAGLGSGASRRWWLAGGAQGAGRVGEALAAVLLLGPGDGENEERIGCGWGSGGPRAASTVFCGMDTTELISEAQFELRIPTRLRACFRMRSALPR
jgi:hypothetical protein